MLVAVSATKDGQRSIDHIFVTLNAKMRASDTRMLSQIFCDHM